MQSVGDDGVGVDEYARTLIVLGRHRVLDVVLRVLVHGALVHSAAPGEEGRGGLGQLLFPPLPLLPPRPHLVTLGGGPACTCSLNPGLLGLPILELTDQPGQLCPDCAVHVLLHLKPRHGGVDDQLPANASHAACLPPAAAAPAGPAASHCAPARSRRRGRSTARRAPGRGASSGARP